MLFSKYITFIQPLETLYLTRHLYKDSIVNSGIKSFIVSMVMKLEQNHCKEMDEYFWFDTMCQTSNYSLDVIKHYFLEQLKRELWSTIGSESVQCGQSFSFTERKTMGQTDSLDIGWYQAVSLSPVTTDIIKLTGTSTSVRDLRAPRRSVGATRPDSVCFSNRAVCAWRQRQLLREMDPFCCE